VDIGAGGGAQDCGDLVEVEGFGPGQARRSAVMAVRFEQHLGRRRGDVPGIDEEQVPSLHGNRSAPSWPGRIMVRKLVMYELGRSTV